MNVLMNKIRLFIYLFISDSKMASTKRCREEQESCSGRVVKSMKIWETVDIPEDLVIQSVELNDDGDLSAVLLYDGGLNAFFVKLEKEDPFIWIWRWCHI